MTNFIVLYGAPSTGKRTIGLQLSKLLQYPLFHNHISVEYVSAVFSYGTAEYEDLLLESRLAVFRKFRDLSRPGLIFTWAYSYPHHERQRRAFSAFFSSTNSNAIYIQIRCPDEVSRERVNSQDRQSLKKISSIEEWDKFVSDRHYGLMPGRTLLTVDSSLHSPVESANLIYLELVSHGL